jgi:glycerol-3-phosphate dehydrogenase
VELLKQYRSNHLVRREQALRAMAASPLDVLVIGGGITGAGVALDAASRGLRVGLVERGDFAGGTSSKSSKLIHGGLRYLKQLQFKVTLEASREKALLKRLAPHLVEDLPFVLPLYKGPLARTMVGAGLWIYDVAAGLPKGHVHRHLSAAQAAREYPALDARRLRGAYVYFDAKADDCRLVMHVVKKASDLGALVANYAPVERLSKGEAVVRDRLDDRAATVRARVIVNATGVWCDEVRRLDDARAGRVVRPSKGVHVVVPRRRVGLETAAILQSPRDGRVIFVIPWGDRAILGTTDTDYAGPLDAARATAEDVDYLLGLVNEHLPAARLGRGDVISTYAGLRPLLLDSSDAPSKASREHHLFRSASGLITITGGKLTTYRRMAKQVVDAFSRRRCRTHAIGLFAAEPDGTALVRNYGSEAGRILDRTPIVDGLDWVWGEVDFAVEREMAVTLSDVLERRTRVSLFDLDRGTTVAEGVARRMSKLLGWSAGETRRQVDAFLGGKESRRP